MPTAARPDLASPEFVANPYPVYQRPDVFDIQRQPNRHLAFGLGIHFCLGAPLARAEARIGFAQLPAERLRLVDPAPDWNASTFFRGLRTLPIE